MTFCRSRLSTALVAVALTLAACGSNGSATADGAKPEFCGWANEIAASVPPAPAPVDPDKPLDVDRLVAISDDLSNFAGTLESAAAFAPVRSQVSFTELASFNREVAAIITGSGSLREQSPDAARTAARTVVNTLGSECGVEISVASTLAFFEG